METEDFDFLVGRTVEQIWVWKGAIRIVFEVGVRPEPDIYLDSTPPSYLRRGGSEVTLDVDRDPVQTGNVLTLLDDRVTRARAVDGVLHVTFVSGAELRSPPDEDYESWTIRGPREVFQCLSGGEITSW